MIKKGQRQVRHELGDGSESGNSHSVHQQVLVPALSHGDNGRRIVAENLAVSELILKTLLGEQRIL